MRRSGFASNGFQLCWRVVYLFSEGFRVQDIATILHVGCTFLKKLIKLYRETSTVNYPAERAVAKQGTRMVCLYCVL